MKYLTTKKLLSKAIMMATLSVSTVTMLPTHAAISMDPADKQALVEQRLDNINEQSELMFKRIVKHPYLENVAYNAGELQHDANAQSATATSELNIKLKEGLLDFSSLDFVIEDTVDYSDELNQQDILARVNSELHLKEGSEAFNELTKEQQGEVQAFFKDIELRTDLLEGSAFKSYFAIPAITSDEEGSALEFGGLTVETLYDDDTFAQGVGKSHVDVKQLTVTENQEEIDYEALMALSQEEQDNLSYEDYPMTEEMVEALDMKPFTADFKVTADGVLSLESSPITMYFNNQSGSFMIEQITGEGNLYFDEDFQQNLGKQHYTAHTVTIQSLDLPTPIVFDSIEYITDLNRENDLFNMQGQFIASPQADSLNALTQGMFGIESLELSFNLNNVSKDALEHFVSLQGIAASQETELSMQDKEVVKSLIDSLSQNGASTGLDIVLSTDKGDATINSTVRLREGSDAQAWIDAVETAEMDSTSIEQLAEQDLYYDAKVVLPIAILDAVGMTDMAQMMAGPYIVKEGDNFTLHIENTGDGPVLNGTPLAEIEAGM